MKYAISGPCRREGLCNIKTEDDEELTNCGKKIPKQKPTFNTHALLLTDQTKQLTSRIRKLSLTSFVFFFFFSQQEEQINHTNKNFDSDNVDENLIKL